jgi:hypothetical protein
VIQIEESLEVIEAKGAKRKTICMIECTLIHTKAFFHFAYQCIGRQVQSFQSSSEARTLIIHGPASQLLF